MCATCGRRLKYLPRKDARHNKAYCSRRCYLTCPPKLAAAVAAWDADDPRTLLLTLLNSGRSMHCVAALLGVHRQALLTWMQIYRIARVDGVAHRPGRYAVVDAQHPTQLALF